MPTPAGPALRKVTLNLYEEDCRFMEQIFGHGWTTRAREIIHQQINGTKRLGARLTLGDLSND